ncbi:hypothetical protein MmiHf6_16790 [Methanimicrococcus hongohii]|uniref:TM2 domain-containing protein n=1 Tax=Methanimicrococcus hongohii TaxID=3028295 RepID=A0AA96V3J1_9EURY|nr:zinc ribbon domain-containing protein [Methanimicrococcus sp. Hf6]WNY24348.1 hypothetical protein MmiHf6_16790 [Methanimicrococcus sp. Hf6]
MANNFCPNCGETVIREDAAICYNCGGRLRENETSQNYQSQNYQPQNNQSQNYQSQNNQSQNYQSQNNQYRNNNYNNQNHYNEAMRTQRAAADPKSPFLAVILSFFWTGLGQLYNGKFLKGILFQIGIIIGFIFLIIPGIIVWIVGLWDAYNDSEKMNRGEIPVANPTFWEIMGFIFFWPLIIICLIFMFMFLMIPFALV